MVHDGYFNVAFSAHRAMFFKLEIVGVSRGEREYSALGPHGKTVLGPSAFV